MRKKSVIISIIGITLIIIMAIIMCNTNKEMTFKVNGITYALTVNGVKQNSFPDKGIYRVDIECSNATCKWDYEDWKLYIEKITGEVSCNISFIATSKTYLNNKIIELSGTTQGTGQIVNEKGYRYEGQDPNNYVRFNNELWRIIGVFDSSTHGVENTNLVKIIRNESIGNLIWNRSTSNNDWSTSTLKNLLNSYYVKGAGTCYTDISIYSNCDFRNVGIDLGYRSMVKNVTWKLGGYSSSNVSVETLYNAERDSQRYDNSYAYELNGNIGLLYPSDYGYSVLSDSCPRTTSLLQYSKDFCAGQSWLYGTGVREYTITPASDDNQVFIIRDNGNLIKYYNFTGAEVRPVLYLDSSVYVLDGDGSITDPYIIGM